MTSFRFKLPCFLLALILSGAARAELTEMGNLGGGGGLVKEARTVSAREYIIRSSNGAVNSIFYNNGYLTAKQSAQLLEPATSSFGQDWHDFSELNFKLQPNADGSVVVIHHSWAASAARIDFAQKKITRRDLTKLSASAQALLDRDIAEPTCKRTFGDRDFWSYGTKFVGQIYYQIATVTCTAAYGREYQLLLAYNENFEIDLSRSRAFRVSRPRDDAGGESFHDLKGIMLSQYADEYVVQKSYTDSQREFEVRDLLTHESRGTFALPASFYAPLGSWFHDYTEYTDLPGYWVAMSQAQVAIVNKKNLQDVTILNVGDIGPVDFLPLTATEILIYANHSVANVLETRFAKIDVASKTFTQLTVPGRVQPRGAMGTGIKAQVTAPVQIGDHMYFLMTDESSFDLGNLSLAAISISKLHLVAQKTFFSSASDSEINRAKSVLSLLPGAAEPTLLFSLMREPYYSPIRAQTLLLSSDLTVKSDQPFFVEPLWHEAGKMVARYADAATKNWYHFTRKLFSWE